MMNRKTQQLAASRKPSTPIVWTTTVWRNSDDHNFFSANIPVQHHLRRRRDPRMLDDKRDCEANFLLKPFAET
jgi:hypothetical protein